MSADSTRCPVCGAVEELVGKRMVLVHDAEKHGWVNTENVRTPEQQQQKAKVTALSDGVDAQLTRIRAQRERADLDG